MEIKRLNEIKERSEKATAILPDDQIRYEHGGGRLAITQDTPDGRHRRLIADVYHDCDREFYFNAREDMADLLSAYLALREEARELARQLRRFADSQNLGFYERYPELNSEWDARDLLKDQAAELLARPVVKELLSSNESNNVLSQEEK